MWICRLRIKASEISGRGVGLYAARAALQEINGGLKAEFLPLPADREGFRAFQFVIAIDAAIREAWRPGA